MSNKKFRITKDTQMWMGLIAVALLIATGYFFYSDYDSDWILAPTSFGSFIFMALYFYMGGEVRKNKNKTKE